MILSGSIAAFGESVVRHCIELDCNRARPRPSINIAPANAGYNALMERCWQHDPKDLGSNLSGFGAIHESRFRLYQKKVLPADFK
jgi:hypothetical protein